MTESCLSTDRLRALTILAAAGPGGAIQALLSAPGFDASVIAGLVTRRLATLEAEKDVADGARTAIVRGRIMDAGRSVLAAED
jgi:hypothetical protein